MRRTLWREPVANATNRLDYAFAPGRPQQSAQPQNVHVHGALFDVDPATPDTIKQLRSIKRSIRVAQQKLQQPEFSWTDVHRMAIDRQPMAAYVQRDTVGFDDTLIRASRAAQQRLDPGNQFPGGNGLVM